MPEAGHFISPSKYPVRVPRWIENSLPVVEKGVVVFRSAEGPQYNVMSEV